jgi:hypothetical protein
MKNVIELLLNLQNLDLGPATASTDKENEIARLRQQIPPQIMGHYDRLRARDKKGVSVVRNGVCSECHMKLASGIYAQLVRADDIVICDSCGRYLTASKEDPAAALDAPPPAEKKITRKPRKKTPPPPTDGVSSS